MRTRTGAGADPEVLADARYTIRRERVEARFGGTAQRPALKVAEQETPGLEWVPGIARDTSLGRWLLSERAGTSGHHGRAL
jgi:hypothetical protein